MLSKCGMNHTAVEQNLGCVGDLIEDFQCLVELVVVVAGEGCHPGLDFLTPLNQQLTQKQPGRKVRTCFRDMTKVSVHLLPGSMVSSSLNALPLLPLHNRGGVAFRSARVRPDEQRLIHRSR